jgi:hypothetical protein
VVSVVLFDFSLEKNVHRVTQNLVFIRKTSKLLYARPQLELAEITVMNRENYKSTRSNPKRNSGISKAKTQMMAKPKASNSGTPKLRAIYNSRTEWITKVIPKQKEK